MYVWKICVRKSSNWAKKMFLLVGDQLGLKCASWGQRVCKDESLWPVNQRQSSACCLNPGGWGTGWGEVAAALQVACMREGSSACSACLSLTVIPGCYLHWKTAVFAPMFMWLPLIPRWVVWCADPGGLWTAAGCFLACVCCHSSNSAPNFSCRTDGVL